MSGVETQIEGSPGAVEGASSWLRQSLAPQVDSAGEAFNDARSNADSSWDGAAGEEFSNTMRRARDRVDDLESACRSMANDLDDFAAVLRRCQDDMREVRAEARGAGLTVAGTVVQDPGPGPARPPDGFTGTEAEVAEHDQSVSAYDDHQDLIRAYRAASTEAARVDRAYAAACRALKDEYLLREHAPWIITVTDLLAEGVVAAAAAARTVRASRLRARAQDLLGEATRAIDDLQANPDRYVRRRWLFFTTLDEARLRADRLAIEGKLDQAGALLDAERKAARPGVVMRTFKEAGRFLGPAGVVAGAYSDYQDGEGAVQIAASQGGSLVAGAAAGAAVGSVVPVAGTVVGAVVGAGVAIFFDGAIDSFFENGPDVGQALAEGWDALGDTGSAVKSGVSGAASTVKGWFS